MVGDRRNTALTRVAGVSGSQPCKRTVTRVASDRIFPSPKARGRRVVCSSVLTAVDHITVRVVDLEKAVDTYRRLGFTLTHTPPSDGEEGVAYAVFGDFHLEFREHPDRSAAQREGLHTLALRCDDIDAEVARLEASGIAVTDPVDDPILIGARSLLRRTAEVDAFIPMRLVELDRDAGEVRSFLGESAEHPNTATVLERTYVAVAAIDQELRAFEQALGQQAPEPEMGTVIMSLMSVFYIGSVGIAVAEPRGAGPTADALSANGPGMFQILLRADHLDEAEEFMVNHGMPAPARGTRLSGESALLVTPDHACGMYVAMAGNR
jgi:catechol 2,3-dioxygenase-like lactoylglutathione lyase family enzyme